LRSTREVFKRSVKSFRVAQHTWKKEKSPEEKVYRNRKLEKGKKANKRANTGKTKRALKVTRGVRKKGAIKLMKSM